MSEILQVDQLNKSFGAVVVSDDLSFSLQEGEALGVIGPNGAGKTTLFNLVAGSLSPDSGDIRFIGSSINKHSPAQRCRALRGPDRLVIDLKDSRLAKTLAQMPQGVRMPRPAVPGVPTTT